MNRIIQKFIKVWLLIVIAAFIASCNKSKNEEISKLESSYQVDIMQQLESGIEIKREEPFNLRPFNPVFDGESVYDAASYGFYRKGQAPGQIGPTEEELIEDLEIISKRWKLVRVYNADDHTELFLQTIQKENFPIKVMLGIWLENETNNTEKYEQNLNNLKKGVELANRYDDIVVAVSVGNEAQVYWSAHKMNIETQTKYIRFVRQNVSLPVTCADDYQFWVADSSRALAGELDFITTHAHPTWNGLSVENSINWLDSIYNSVQANHTEKIVVIGETGWPTDYDEAKVGDGQQGTLVKGEVSVEAQNKFYELYDEWLNDKKVVSFLFEVFDEPWKGGGENTSEQEIEKNWGLYYENRKPKKQ